MCVLYPVDMNLPFTEREYMYKYREKEETTRKYINV